MSGAAPESGPPVTPLPPAAATLTGECGDVKSGRVNLRCTLPRDHDKPQDGQPGTWHESAFTEHQEITYPGAHHVITTEETVTWEPADHVAEAVRHLFAGRKP